MGQLVEPRVFLVGYTTAHMDGIEAYLRYTGKEGFLESWAAAGKEGLSDGERLCSMFAKLCYDSLVIGKNSNISQVRDIADNIKGTFAQGHGSVFEHATVNFIITDCSRVFTHELVRHRAGTAFSQTSGRYCRLDNINLVHDPILDDCRDLLTESIAADERFVYLMECRKGLRKPPEKFPNVPAEACFWSDEAILQHRNANDHEHDYNIATYRQAIRWENVVKGLDFTYKKQVTSAIRRIAPNGQANEIGFSVNFRALRHYAQLRSGRHAEWEIRCVTEQVYSLLQMKFPLLFHGAKTEMVKGYLEISGMKMQPYEIDLGDPAALRYWSVDDLEKELNSRYDAK